MDFLKEVRPQIRVGFVASRQAFESAAEFDRGALVALVQAVDRHQPAFNPLLR
jgi:hypothetical protein